MTNEREKLKQQRVKMLRDRIASLKESIADYTPREWHYRSGLESLESLQKTLVLNEMMLILVANDLPVYFFSGLTEPLGISYKYYSSVVATA